MRWLAAGLAALFWLSPPEPEVNVAVQHLRFVREVAVPAGPEPRACAVLDADVYAHARAGLDDVRLLANGVAIPYVLTASLAERTTDAATVVNQGRRGGRIVFDLKMPARAYSEVLLDLDAKDFIASAEVTGLPAPGAPAAAGTALGTFTLFDLSGQRLGRSTVLKLAEASFPVLHVELTLRPATGSTERPTLPDALLRGAEVPPSREAQVVYTAVASTGDLATRGRETVARFTVSARVPVERVRFLLAPADRTNFSRAVEVRAKTPEAEQERAAGTISRVVLKSQGQEIREESLTIPVTLASNNRAPAEIEVAVQNGDDRPLALREVRLEMRERKLCFDVPPEPVTMRYGDAALTAPQYDLARLFAPGEGVRTARLGPEEINPGFRAREDARSLTERHPELVWVALLAVVGVLGVVAFRSAKRF